MDRTGPDRTGLDRTGRDRSGQDKTDRLTDCWHEHWRMFEPLAPAWRDRQSYERMLRVPTPALPRTTENDKDTQRDRATYRATDKPIDRQRQRQGQRQRQRHRQTDRELSEIVRKVSLNFQSKLRRLPEICQNSDRKLSGN